ncbi:MAG: glutamine synthetase [Clostridia bacterium]|nr:glutamine synthetase [Clostridia bacterium]
MKYSKEAVLQYVMEEDVKFVRLAFCDVFGKQKNVAIMAEELARAFEFGISIDASAIAGFGDETHSDLLLHPEPDTLALLPWRPEHGKVVRMFASISYPDGTPFECDTRAILKKAIADAETAGLSFSFGPEQEFYLFLLEENGETSKVPYDNAGYMDLAPDDKGENVRREICLTLEKMGIRPESSHHEEGPGQNEIDFRFSDPLTAADNTLTFQTVVKTVAYRNGLFADFSAKPLVGSPGNGFHINISVKGGSTASLQDRIIAGILDKIKEITLFLNPTELSYKRLGSNKAPGYISWSEENRSQLIRVPAASGDYRRIELRSADPTTNPYLAFSLLIYASLYGIEKKLPLQKNTDINLFTASEEELSKLEKLPSSLSEARKLSEKSDFIQSVIPPKVLAISCGK